MNRRAVWEVIVSLGVGMSAFARKRGSGIGVSGAINFEDHTQGIVEG